MRIAMLLFAIISLAPAGVNAQKITFDLVANGDTLNLYPPDTLKTCRNTPVTFEAFTDTLIAGTDTIPPDELMYEWNFGDNDTETGLGADSVEHEYTRGSGYYLQLVIKQDIPDVNQDSVGKAVIPIQVALEPDFSETETLPDHPVCLGDTISLRGNAAPSEWEFEPVTTHEEDDPFILSEQLRYFSFITLESFDAYQKLENLDSLKDVCVTMEHSNTQDFAIWLTAPNDSTIKLKSHTAEKTYAGLPVDKEGVTIEGEGMRYCWSTDPFYGTMNDEAGQHDTTYTGNNDSTYTDHPYLPADAAYKPFEPFDKLVGTPLNGDWQLEIEDDSIYNNGYIFSWELNFKDTFFTPKMKYENTYSSGLWGEHEDGVESGTDTIGNAYARPPELGSTNYTYKVKSTEWGCKHEKTLFAEATQAALTANPQEGQADPELTVNFESTTEWAERWNWYFGKEGEGAATENPSHVYTEKGEYPVYLIAESAQGNTSRSDTTIILVTVPEAKLELPNVFTPNGDSKNDVFIPKNIQALKQVNGKILNRWGRVVCEFKSQEELEAGWDGTLNNKGNAESAPGVYYYVIIAKGKNGEDIKRKGMLHLLRSN